MATQPNVGENTQIADSKQESNAEPVGWSRKIEERYGRIKTHAQTYPYVWGSYILVYSVLGSWLAYRWTKLRRTELRVQMLQEKLRKMVESEQQQLKNSAADAGKSANSASATNKPPPSADKVDR